MKTNEIKERLECFCKENDFLFQGSYPIISSDKDLLFVNASITPFRKLFRDPIKHDRHNKMSIIQKCIRIGGGAYSLSEINTSNYCNTFFEMFGCTIFQSNHRDVMGLLFKLFDCLIIDKHSFIFTIPENDILFKDALLANGIRSNKIFEISGNDIYWTKWKFGKDCVIGHGLTAIFARSNKDINGIEETLIDEDEFIPLLNVIYIDRKEKGDKISYIDNPGFDLAIGIERLSSVLQGCNTYQIDIMKEKSQIVNRFFHDSNINISENEIKITIDYLRTIGVLIEEGLLPSKNKSGYVLRKLIRTVIEIFLINKLEINMLLDVFYRSTYLDGETSAIINIINQEKKSFYKNIAKIRKNQNLLNISADKLRESYGLSPRVVKFIKEN